MEGRELSVVWANITPGLEVSNYVCDFKDSLGISWSRLNYSSLKALNLGEISRDPTAVLTPELVHEAIDGAPWEAVKAYLKQKDENRKTDIRLGDTSYKVDVLGL